MYRHSRYDAMLTTLGSHQLKDHIYATSPDDSNFIGKRKDGAVSNYYLGEITTDDEVAAVQAAAEKAGVDVLNTRCVGHCSRREAMNSL